MSDLPALAAVQENDTQRPFAALCGPEGVFSLQEIPLAGVAVLRVEAEGFCTEYLELLLSQENEPQKLVLARGIAVRGRVLSHAGVAVSDAIVRLMMVVYAGSDPQSALVGGKSLWEWCRTDERGAFMLTLRRLGSLTLGVDSPSVGRATFADLTT
jgi:hypothetical protein